VVQDHHGEDFTRATFNMDTTKMPALNKSMVYRLNAEVYDVVDNYGECTGITLRVLLNGVVQYQDSSTIHTIESTQLNSATSAPAERNDSMPHILQVRAPHESESEMVILCAKTPCRDEATMSPLQDIFQGLSPVSHQGPMASAGMDPDELTAPHESESEMVILCAETPCRDEATMSPLQDMFQGLSPVSHQFYSISRKSFIAAPQKLPWPPRSFRSLTHRQQYRDGF
jgi:hypothetical protein